MPHISAYSLLIKDCLGYNVLFYSFTHVGDNGLYSQLLSKTRAYKAFLSSKHRDMEQVDAQKPIKDYTDKQTHYR